MRWCVVGLCLGCLLPAVSAQDLSALERQVARKYPDVKQLSTAALAAWLADSNRPAPVLVDARSAEEFQVSHLPGARHLDSVRAVQSQVRPTNLPLVVYCAVGYRSSALAQKLQRAGYKRVWNLEGSLFKWANEGRPVYRGSTPVTPTRVHPYSRRWGEYLAKHLHAPPDSR